MRKVPRSPVSTHPIRPVKFAGLLTGALAVMAIAASQSAAQTLYSARSTRAQPVASGGGFFGTLFGGGARHARTPNSSAYGSYNTYGSYQGYGGYGAGYGRYRTLCVRTCDGYYWPVSYSTTQASFTRDARQCQSSCETPARLFVYRNPGADVQNMVDLQGKPYAQTLNAFRYRTEYVKDCRCKPEPWSAEAKQDYARRESGEAAPGQVKTATAQEKGSNMALTPGPAAASARQNARDRSQSARRRTYRTNEASRYDGKWWAGSW